MLPTVTRSRYWVCHCFQTFTSFRDRLMDIITNLSVISSIATSKRLSSSKGCSLTTTAWLNSVRALSLEAPVLSSFKTISLPCVSLNFATLVVAVWLSVPPAIGCVSRVLAIVLAGGRVSRKCGNCSSLFLTTRESSQSFVVIVVIVAQFLFVKIHIFSKFKKYIVHLSRLM